MCTNGKAKKGCENHVETGSRADSDLQPGQKSESYACMYVCNAVIGATVSVYVCMYVCMYVGRYVCTYVCMYV